MQDGEALAVLRWGADERAHRLAVRYVLEQVEEGLEVLGWVEAG